jgi:3'-phosphoadenosine 5'-phosphosulfate sulfotransferase (PAPS reductase)/FAD synthetase
MEYKNIVCCSGGNDSVALIQYLYKQNKKNVTVIYNNTGWAREGWEVRIQEVKDYCNKIGFNFSETQSEGFRNMALRKKGFPMCASKMQFCTSVLKTEPTLEWLRKNDPNKNAVIFIGVRREESVNRKNHPEEIIFHEKYEGRLQRFPLVKHTERDRDFLIDETGLDILLHSSMECFPCVCSNRSDLRLLSKDKKKIEEIAMLEIEMGFTSKNKPRVMFRPYRHMGATGIKQVIEWALSERGKYNKQ